MSAKKFNSSDLSPLVELGISILKRYYNHSKALNALSLIYFKVPNAERNYEEIFERILRHTDAVVREDNHFIAILYGTNETGASKLLSGIQEFLNEKPIDLIVSYPKHGKSAEELIVKLQDDIKDNYGVILNCLNIDKPFEIFEN